MSATVERETSVRRGTVRALSVRQLDDGRVEMVVSVLTPSGLRGRITVQGQLFMPCVGEPWEAPTLVLELVPVGEQGPSS